MARDLAAVAEEFEGRFLAGLVDIDAQPEIAQAVQLQAVPFVFAVIDGRPQPLIQDVLTLDDLRAAINQVMQQLTTQGITGRHQPRSAAAPVGEEDEDGEPPLDPRYAAGPGRARRHDFDAAVAEYQKLIDANPADAEAAAGLAMAKVLQRTAGRRRRRRPARPPTPRPTTSRRRPWSPTSTCSSARSTTRSTGWSSWYVVRRRRAQRRPASTCSALFAAVGNDDPRVLKGRQGAGERAVLSSRPAARVVGAAVGQCSHRDHRAERSSLARRRATQASPR